ETVDADDHVRAGRRDLDDGGRGVGDRRGRHRATAHVDVDAGHGATGDREPRAAVRAVGTGDGQPAPGLPDQQLRRRLHQVDIADQQVLPGEVVHGVGYDAEVLHRL